MADPKTPDKPKKERKPLRDANAGAAWECPFCKKLNGIPERPVCDCGARLDGDHATK